MRSGVSASASPTTFSTPPSKPQTTHYYASSSLTPRTLSSSDLNLKSIRFSGAKGPQRITVSCNSSSRPGGPGPGDSDSRGVLDAFFLGKALAEAVNERIESTVGEFLSTIGRLQAEQQKQVQDFQDDVLERAKIAKEKAAREAVEAQGLTSKPSIVSTKPVANGVSSVTSPSTTNTSAPATPSSLSGPTTPAVKPNADPANEEPVLREGTDD